MKLLYEAEAEATTCKTLKLLSNDRQEVQRFELVGAICWVLRRILNCLGAAAVELAAD